MSYSKKTDGTGSSAPARIFLVCLLIAISLASARAGAIEPACGGPSGCTGDIGTAGMCGFNEQITRLDDFCVLNNCQDPEIIGGPIFELEPTGPGQFIARMVVEIEAPWNSWANDPDVNPNATPNGTLDVIWYENAPDTPEPWTGAPGAVSICEDLRHDRVLTWIQKPVTCSQLRSGSIGVYSLRAMACGGPCPPPFFPNCGSFCGRWTDFGGLTFEVPEQMINEFCPLKDDCDCPCPGGASGAGAGPGGCFGDVCYKAGGHGATGSPGGPGSWPKTGSAAALAAPLKVTVFDQLGRYWAHPYAERLLPGLHSDQAWMITRKALYREFWDQDGDGEYEWTSPKEQYSRLYDVVSGWELRHLDGTVQSFDGDGLWTETRDRNGNTTTATYAAGVLTRVDFPDARAKTFSYHAGGKLATITEIGADGTSSRTWSYTWSGDDLVRIDRPDGTAWELRYDDPRHPGYMTRKTLVGTDASERVDQAWEYDGFANVTHTWRGDPLLSGPAADEIFSFAFDRPRNPEQSVITSPIGQLTSVEMTRDPDSNNAIVTSISGDCSSCGLGPNTQLRYDDARHPFLSTRRIDARGKVTLFEYDADGRKTLRTEARGTPLERTTVWEYDPAFPALVTAIEQPSTSGSGQRRTSWVFDGAGNATTRTETGVENGSAFSYATVSTFNSAGQPKSTDPPGFGTQDRTSFAYDPARGNLILSSRTNPLIGTTSFDYDGFNRRTRVTDPNGAVVETFYDALDRVERVVQRGATVAEDLVTLYTYTPYGELFQTILPEGNVIERSYDDLGRLLAIERKPDPATPGDRVLYTLNGLGQHTREELQSWDGSGWQTGSRSDFAYSSSCKLERILHPDGSVTEFDYDCLGRLEREWDANHPSNGRQNPASRTYSYDDLGRLRAVTSPWGGAGSGTLAIRYDYDVQDHLTRVVDGTGTVSLFDYSDRDLLTRKTTEDAGTTTYGYNEHGYLTEEVDSRARTILRTIDALDRLTLVDYPDDSLDIRFVYDDPSVPFSRGRLSAIIRNGEALELGYDRFGRSLRDGALTYTYDKNGNRRTVAYPGGLTATYAHDFADREASLTIQGGAAPPQSLVTAASYLPNGPLVSLTLGNGLTESRDFTSRYFPSSLVVGSQLSWTFATDAAGNVTAVNDSGDPTASRSYEYQDHQYFLTRADGPWGNLTWTYDRLGNRLSETRDGDVTTYVYRPNDAGGNSPQLISSALGGAPPAIRYSYDAAGNLTHENRDDSKIRYRFNAEDRLSQIRFDTGDQSVALTDLRYDGRGFLSSSILVPTLSQPLVSWQTRATYTSDGVLLHRDEERRATAVSSRAMPTTSEASYFFYFADRPVARLAIRTTTPPGGVPSTTSKLTYFSTDHLGSPVLATDAAGVNVWKGGFEPFGGDFADARGSGVVLRLPGQWQDATWQQTVAGADLYYNVHRWYRPREGRYLRPDPEFVAGYSPYLYAVGDPINVSDPLGLLPDSFDADTTCLLCTVYAEGRGTPESCQEALANIILNRARRCNDAGIPSTICDIVSAGRQFDGYNNQNYRECEDCDVENPPGELGDTLDFFEDGFSTAPDDVVFFANNTDAMIRYFTRDLPQNQTQIRFPSCTTFAFFKRDPFIRPNRRPAFCR